MKGWLLLPVIVLALGLFWMAAAIRHFEHQTGRKFWGLAGTQVTWPKEMFQPTRNSSTIIKWTTGIPSGVTALALILCGVGLTLRNRSARLRSRICLWLVVIICLAILLTANSWVALNITGVFS